MGKEIRKDQPETKRPGALAVASTVYPGLYISADGTITCGNLKCAGMTAYFSAMTKDLHGAPIRRVGIFEVVEFKKAGLSLACERCGSVQR